MAERREVEVSGFRSLFVFRRPPPVCTGEGLYGLDQGAAGITVTGSFEQRSLLDLRQAEFPVHLRQKMPFGSQRIRAQREITWGGQRSSKGIRVPIAALAGTRAVGLCGWWFASAGRDVDPSEQRNLSYEARRAP